MDSDDLKLSNYYFELPPERVATRPLSVRHDSRLLVYDQRSDRVTHTQFFNLGDFIPAHTTLVCNVSKVYPCRLIGHKESGGKCEIFLLSNTSEGGIYPALIRTTGKKHIGDKFLFEHEVVAELVEIRNGTFGVTFNNEKILPKLGKIPIPPYIREGESDERDGSDYQTVYAKVEGSIAAPTAGFHFTVELLECLKKREIDMAEVILHVGRGTFAAVKTEEITQHQMHSENFFVDTENLAKIQKAKSLYAVGTTSLRVLESIKKKYADQVNANEIYDTDIFLYPGVNVDSIDGLITNFHLPKSTLLMLVSALIGREKTLALYAQAIEHNYRFFSYGDAMLIIRDRNL